VGQLVREDVRAERPGKSVVNGQPCGDASGECSCGRGYGLGGDGLGAFHKPEERAADNQARGEKQEPDGES